MRVARYPRFDQNGKDYSPCNICLRYLNVKARANLFSTCIPHPAPPPEMLYFQVSPDGLDFGGGFANFLNCIFL